jgi:predicted RNA-binding protein with PUA-like domain
MPRKTKSRTAPEPAGAETPRTGSEASYWLFKSEPDSFSWTQQKAKGRKGEPWEGVRNFQARNNMRLMHVGDRGFFYHSNQGKEIVGVVEVCARIHPDASDASGQWECVDVRALVDMPKPVALTEVRSNPKLARMALVTSSRLSVQPVRDEEWREICAMGGLDPQRLSRTPAT